MSPMMQRYMKSQTTSSASDSAFAIGSRNQALSSCRFCCTRHQGRQKTKDASLLLGHFGDQPFAQCGEGRDVAILFRSAAICLGTGPKECLRDQA